MKKQDKTEFEALLEVMARLRGADGCPWDREQDHASLKPFLLEEAYEALEAIDEGDDGELCKELGDVLLQVVFHAQIAAEEQRFTMAEVCRAIVDKMIRRHPHVFGSTKVENADQVLSNWEQIKRSERREAAPAPSALDGVPRQLPALLRAQRLQDKAARLGFDWPDIEGPLDKIEEELAELKKARADGEAAAIEAEFGDLLFSLVNVGRFLGLCPEEALRQGAAKFERRFRSLEERFAAAGNEIEAASLEEMDRVWDQIKETER